MTYETFTVHNATTGAAFGTIEARDAADAVYRLLGGEWGRSDFFAVLAFEHGQTVCFRPFYASPKAKPVRAVYLSTVPNAAFPDVVLHRLELLEAVPAVTLKGFNGKPDSTYRARARGEVISALSHEVALS